MDGDITLASLNEKQLAKLKALEQELGSYVLAFEQPLAPATLTAEQVQKLQEAEVELGLCLVAYRKR